MSEFVRCQRCGASADSWDDHVICGGCGERSIKGWWNNANLQVRADKRFQLVVAMAGGWMASPDNDDDTSTMRNRARGFAYCADAILNEMYGEVKAKKAEVEK